MAQLLLSFYLALVITVCNVTKQAPTVVDAKFFEYELPNRTVTICPTYSLISLECPQVSSSSDHHAWHQPQPAQYLISVDYIRSFPSRLGLDASSCQPDVAHACHNYDLRYVNTLCNGKPQCPDIPAYQVRDRSLCAFKAVTEIGYHCVPTWYMHDIQTKCDICKNGSLTNDYGFIYSRNYPLTTLRIPCFTTIYARPNHKTVLYFVNGQLNFDQLRIESVSSGGLTILNLTLNGNLSTQRLAASTYEMRVTFLPGHVYAHHPTYYLLYFYTVPICSVTDPCPLPPPTTTTTVTMPPTTTSRVRIQSVGWTRIPNIWIVIPIVLAYILLLLLVIVLALLFQRRRRQRKAIDSVGTSNLSSRYLDTSGTSSRAQLVTPLPPINGNGMSTHSSRHQPSISHSSHYPIPTHSFAQNMERYHRESRSDFDLHQSSGGGVDYRFHSSIPYRGRPAAGAGGHRPYGTMDYPSYYSGGSSRRRSLPKSFSDCDLCKRRVVAEEYNQYHDQDDDNWRLENTLERRAPSQQPRAYREKIKERFRERLTVRKVPDADVLPPTTAVEYSTVLPRHQRASSESNRTGGTVHHLPFEYIPNESNTNVRTVEYKRNSNQEHLAVGGQHRTGDEGGTSNFTVKFYEHDDDDENDLDRRLHEAREVQEMSMRMNEQQQQQQQQQQQHVSRHQYHHHQQRRYTGASGDI